MSTEGQHDVEPMLLFKQLVDELPLTYRQADYLVRCGLIETEFRCSSAPHLEREPGSGHVRVISHDEAAVLRMYVRVVAFGLGGKEAVEIARSLVEDGEHHATGAGLRVVTAPQRHAGTRTDDERAFDQEVLDQAVELADAGLIGDWLGYMAKLHRALADPEHDLYDLDFALAIARELLEGVGS